MMNYNFAIVYSENDNDITIYDILINNALDKDIISTQYKLGLEQFKSDKNMIFVKVDENSINKQLIKMIDLSYSN